MNQVKIAHKNITSIIEDVFEHTDKQRAVVVYDTNSTLSNLLYSAYKLALPDATFINFDATDSQDILEIFNALEALDFVALIQSTNFRLNAFRIRVELFKLKIKVIEHPHLSRMSEDEIPTYIDSLLYDKEYYRGVGYALKSKIDKAGSAVIESDGEFLFYDSSFESAKLNIGDYSIMPNSGGQFPIGEVFTESKDLEALHGRVKISVFSNTSYKTNKPQTPAILIIEKGKVIATENTTPAFDEVLELIREGEGEILVRELGFGLNRAFSKTKIVSDTGTYERMCGVHLSLGRKHGMYAKPGIKRGEGKFHVDVFVDITTVKLDDEVIFKNEAWIV
ncbi:hypothetical protein JHD47_01360 [Sulfurimonas sp. SAG-AH-194-L11]|nr:hypothetical protein [Sulfurimonas sp. SAG-AH-194-L11]MDF1876462.1 hypothetical protein [Sulfurimonas sp. SAG-AH-194-L11]